MKLGFVTAILPDLDLSEVVQFAAAEDYTALEIMCWPKGKAERRYAGITHIDIADLSESRASEINGEIAEAGLTISGLGYYPNPLTPDAVEAQIYIDHIRDLITAARKLGVGTVNTFIGRDPAKSIDGNWPRFKQVWEPLIKHAESEGVRVGIENCPMYFTNDEWPSGKNLAYAPAIWQRMFEEIPSDSFGLNFDPSHFVWMRMDYLKAMRDFADKLFHVHAKDARVDKHLLDEVGILATPLEYHTPKLPGLGDVNWGQFFSVLGEVGYAGPVCVEVEDRPYEKTLEGRKEALRQSARYLRQFVPEMD